MKKKPQMKKNDDSRAKKAPAKRPARAAQRESNPTATTALQRVPKPAPEPAEVGPSGEQIRLEADVRKFYVPAVLLDAVSGVKGLSREGTSEYLAQALRAAGDPSDPLERSLVQIGMATSSRAMATLAEAAYAADPERAKILDGTALALSAETRRIAESLKGLRSGRTPAAVLPVAGTPAVAKPLEPAATGGAGDAVVDHGAGRPPQPPAVGSRV